MKVFETVAIVLALALAVIDFASICGIERKAYVVEKPNEFCNHEKNICVGSEYHNKTTFVETNLVLGRWRFFIGMKEKKN